MDLNGWEADRRRGRQAEPQGAGGRKITPVGARTQWEVGGPPPSDAVEVRAPVGVITYEPADMTVTVAAGTTFAEVDAVLREHGQEVPLDPRTHDATIGGILACGLSGIRRARYGPLRDHVLEVQFITGYGKRVKGGGPTVKNVTGYDIPRLFVGSLGTLGLLLQTTLRCRPRASHAAWFAGADTGACFRPSSRLWDGAREMVLLEGVQADVAAQSHALTPIDTPALPDGPHRGRISIEPCGVRALAAELHHVRWCAELDVGTIHVAADTADALANARATAHAHGGRLLREKGGAPDDDGFGCPLPNIDVMRRIKDAFDPERRCNIGRLPL